MVQTKSLVAGNNILYLSVYIPLTEYIPLTLTPIYTSIYSVYYPAYRSILTSPPVMGLRVTVVVDSFPKRVLARTSIVPN